MKLIFENKRSDDFSDDFMYKFESLRNVNELMTVVQQLKDSKYDFSNTYIRITYSFDHSNYRDDDKFDNLDAFFQFYAKCHSEDVEQISLESVIMDRNATITIYPNSDMMRVSVEKKNEINGKKSHRI